MYLKILLQELRQSQLILRRGLSTNTKPSWDIITGVCVERLPVVTPPLNAIQKKYKEMLYTIEVQKSLKSDHELRHDSDKIQAELLKNENADVDLDVISKITAQDFEDASTEELANFKFADIVTEADKTGNKASIERCLQRHLVLVTLLKLGKDTKTILPQGKWQEGETLRQTAERVLSQHCGSDLKVQFLSNAPCGFYKYKYPSEIEGKYGAKVFFYYANYKSGVVRENAKGNWLTRTELTETLPDKYRKSIEEFLITETY